jgi:hypothetical protein
VIIIRLDGQQSLLHSNEWSEYIADTGLTIEVSAPDVHEQNGGAEKSGAVLTHRAGKLKSSGQLPNQLWFECYEAAAYILNRMPTRRLDWLSPLGKLQQLTGVPVPEPKIAHLRTFGSRAYALNYHIDKYDRLEPRVHIGYLVGYESTNIFKVWVPHLSRVISARDVTFDETRRYQSTDTFELVSEAHVRSLEIRSLDVEDEADVEIPARALDCRADPPSAERSLDAPQDTIIVDSGEGIDHGVGVQLPTPGITPEPEAPHRVLENQPDKRRIATTGIAKNMDEDLILPTNRRSQTREAHAVSLANLHYNSAYYTAFATGITHQHRRLHRTELPPEPSKWSDMLRHSHRAGFMAAVEREYSDLQEHGTFVPVPEAEAEAFVIPTRWVFTYKFDEEGYLLKYKARLVVRGDLQPKQDEETYAATLAARVFRFLMALAAYFDLEAKQFDAVNAFTNAKIKSKVWIRFPPGKQVPGHVLLLQRALYGLRVSPLLWYEHLCEVMRKLGLKPVPECACLFTNEKLIVFFYVDDIVVLFHPSEELSYLEFRDQLMAQFKLREMGDLKWFLGIRILRDRVHHKIWLCQDSYVSKIARTFNLVHRKARTPLAVEPLTTYDGTATPEETLRYQRKIGSIGYPASITRPDCARALQKLSQFLQNPGPAHHDAADQCIAYLHTTKTYALEYGSADISPVLLTASDASFADDIVRRWSTEGGLFQLFGGCIDWFCTLQRTVTTSSTEAELLALSHICAWLFWWRRVFNYLEFELDSDTTVNCDNLQTVRLMMKESPKLVTKLKHIDIHQHWLRQETEKGTVKIEWISTNEMPADGLTKALGPQKHEAFCRQLNLVDIKPLLDQIDSS